MVHFIATGTISADVVRKETAHGVLAVFRLSTGTRRQQFWIDTEAWGHTAGVLAAHGEVGRPIQVSGRLTLKTWADRDTGESRSRFVVTATDVDLAPTAEGAVDFVGRNAIAVVGRVDGPPTIRPAGEGTVMTMRVAAGRAGTKTGRIWVDVERWTPKGAEGCQPTGLVSVHGYLAYGAAIEGGRRRGFYVSAETIELLA